MSTRISETLDKEVNDHVTRQVVRETPFQTRTDCLASSVHDAVVAILKRWPELRGKPVSYTHLTLPTILLV